MLPMQLKWHTLLVECIEALDDKVSILSLEESKDAWALFKKNIPVLSWGSIDWSKTKCKETIEYPEQIIFSLSKLLQSAVDEQVYVFWNDAAVPVIKTDLSSVVAFFDDVISVAPDTWLVNFEEGYVVQIFHDGEMAVGLLPKRKQIAR